MNPSHLAQQVPAIAGGTPAKTVPYGKEPRYGEAEMAQLREALEQGSLFYAHGRKVRDLETAFAQHIGSRHAIACSSGTAAIHAALIAAGISPGDEVIVPPITDMGSVIPVLAQGGIPVFADLDPHSYCLNPRSVEAVITPATRAILAVHLWGNACDLTALGNICDRHGLILVEDCAQAWGTTFDGKPVGTLGTIGCYSLNEFKHISCGDGGLVATDDDDLAVRIRLATDKGYDRSSGAAYRHPTFLCANYRMTELQGAVALAQLDKLDSIVSRRRAWCRALSDHLDAIPGLDTPKVTEGCDPSWWFYMLRVDPETLGDADVFAEGLRAEGVTASAYYIGQCVYEYPLFVDHSAFESGEHPFQKQVYGPGLCPVAENVLKTAIVLPVNEAYTVQDLEETVTAIRRVAMWTVEHRNGHPH